MIYRRLHQADRLDPSGFDAFNITPGAHDVGHVNELLNLGKEGYGYFNAQQRPCEEWDDGEGGYMRRMKQLAPLTAPDGRVAKFPWFPCANGDRELIAWGDFDNETIISLAESLKRMAAAYVRPLIPMLDMTWPKAPWWMFRADGPQRGDWPAEYWVRYHDNMLSFIRLLGSAPKRPLCNGDRDLAAMGFRCYLEHADYPENWERDKDIWLRGLPGEHLLSLTPTASSSILLEAYAAYQPWRILAFDPPEHPLGGLRYQELKQVHNMKQNASLWE